MSLIKSFAIGNGDMFYIRHGSDNFTIIDCSIPDDRTGTLLAELHTESKSKGITRFISTHPVQGHIGGLVELDDHLRLANFYTVENAATKSQPTADFDRYVELRDSSKAFYIYKGCSRRWMNDNDDDRGSSGLDVLWPDTTNVDFLDALDVAAAGGSPNNISPIIRYSLNGGQKSCGSATSKRRSLSRSNRTFRFQRWTSSSRRTTAACRERCLTPGSRS